MPEPNKDIDFEIVMGDIGGFGKFQLVTLLLIVIPAIFSASSIEFVFTAANLPHRCHVPQCEASQTDAEFEPYWLYRAIPQDGENFDQCARYLPLTNETVESCPADIFYRDDTESCRDGYVHELTNSIVYDFDIQCQQFRRVIIGAVRNFGQLLGLPVFGYVADKFGRRVALVVSVMNSAIFGIIRAFSTSYEMFVSLQFFESFLSAGLYISCFVLATELVGSKHRIIVGAIISSSFGVGLMLVGATAWLVQPWRALTLFLYVPQLIFIVYYWILNESVRWLLIQQKFDRAERILRKAANMNGKELADKTMGALISSMNKKVSPKNLESHGCNDEQEKRPTLFWQIVCSPTMLRRVCTTPVWWITTTLVYYGMSINSVELAGNNMYLNFILVTLVEIPGNISAVLLVDRIGRKITLLISYFCCAACLIAFPFLPSDIYWLSLLVFLAGKYFISIVFTAVYTYTAELYPTNHRQSLIGFSSTIGRIGSITAPLTPALADFWHGVPSILFGTMAFISGCLVLTTPETLNTKLPDTIPEAEKIGK